MTLIHRLLGRSDVFLGRARGFRGISPRSVPARMGETFNFVLASTRLVAGGSAVIALKVVGGF